MIDLIKKLFPTLADADWDEINLEKESRLVIQEPNPLLDPEQCACWIQDLHDIRGCDYSYGGYMEDRSHMWRGHYLVPETPIHLGVDFNVPAGIQVHLPISARLVHSQVDDDQEGGWGGQLIFKAGDIHFIFGHLDISHIQGRLTGKVLLAGCSIGTVTTADKNGGWYPHLHLQCMKAFNPGIDGYAAKPNRKEFPNPQDLLKAKLSASEMAIARRKIFLDELVPFVEDLLLDLGRVVHYSQGSCNTHVIRQLDNFHGFSFHGDFGHTMFGGNDIKITFGKSGKEVLKVEWQPCSFDSEDCKVEVFEAGDRPKRLKRIMEQKDQHVAAFKKAEKAKKPLPMPVSVDEKARLGLK